MNFKVVKTKHNGKENEGFNLVRPHGTDDYLFLHFKSPVNFIIDNQKKIISPDTCIILSPKTPHFFSPYKCALVHNWMHFIPFDEKGFLSLGLPINTFFTPVNTGFITSSVKKCEIELIYKDSFFEEIVSSEVTNMFIRLKRQLSENSSSPHTEPLKALRLNIYRNPNTYASTVEMAASVGLSRSRFSVIYKDLFKISPKNDLINARVSRASHLLSLGMLSLTEIAEMCGYQSIYHFIRQFKAVTGTTPGVYRKS